MGEVIKLNMNKTMPLPLNVIEAMAIEHMIGGGAEAALNLDVLGKFMDSNFKHREIKFFAGYIDGPHAKPALDSRFRQEATPNEVFLDFIAAKEAGDLDIWLFVAQARG